MNALNTLGYIFLTLFVITASKANTMAYAFGIKHIESKEEFNDFLLWNGVHATFAVLAFVFIING